MIRIVVPLDGSTRSEQALGTAERLARQLHGRIELIRVVQSGETPSSAPGNRTDRTLRYLETIADSLTPSIPTDERIIEGENPAAEVISFAGSSAGTFIVMSTSGHGALGCLVFGSVADDVVRHAHVPVVLVREDPASQSGLIRRIVLPLDGSLLAEQALPQAAELARSTDATISLVQVIDLPPDPVYSDVGYASGVVFDAVERSREDARSYLNAVANRLRSNGTRATWEVRVGGAAMEITRAATTTGADLIVMSTHGRTGLRRIALGSVMQAVVRSGTTPVMVVPSASPSTLNGSNQRVPSSVPR